MVRVEIVAYTGLPDGFSAWPVPSSSDELVLDGRLSEERVGLLVANIAWLARPRRGSILARSRHPPALERLVEPRAVVQRILRATTLGVHGGVRLVDDTTSTVLDPGCCVLVDDWLDWADLVRGESLVLGHDPELVVDVRGDTCLAWSTDRADVHDDGLLGRGPLPHEPRLEFPAADVPEQLVAMRRDLRAAIDRVGLWATAFVPDQAEDLVARLQDAWGVAEYRPPRSVRRTP